ncbi:MAG: alpha/beta fold hydrolase [Paracoccaceae bacterium]
MDMRAVPAVWSQSFGTGPRRAVALHCSLARSGAWSGMAAKLADRLTMAAPDLPGHGQSPDWDGAGDYTGLCARAAAGMIGASAGGPVDLIGHSGGAVAAILYALAHPERVRTLTLIEPVLFAAARGTPEGAAHAAAMAQVWAREKAGDREGAAAVFTGLWGKGKGWGELDPRQRRYISDRIHLIGAGMPALDQDNGDILGKGRLERLTMPAMLISGGASPPVVHVIAERIAARLPEAGLAEVPGAGHMLPITHPAEVAGLVAANLDRALEPV